MKPIVGIGKLGSVFARGFPRLGYPVYPVTRIPPMTTGAAELSAPGLVLLVV